MPREADQDRPDYHKWREDPFEFTTNPRILNNRPSTCILDEDIPKKRDAERKLSFVVEIFYRGGRGLSQDRRKARENTVIAFRMYHFENIPVKIIAQEFNCDDTTVYRYIAEIETILFESEKICLELKDRFVSDNEWECLQVLHYIIIGKQIENIILTSIREPFTFECADEEDKKRKLREIEGAEETHEKSLFIKWKNALSLKDVVAATEKIRRAARVVFNLF